MPLVNVIKGEQLPNAVFNVRTPILRLPWWAIICWQLVKALVWVVLAFVRFWHVTVPATVLTWLYLRYGWVGPVGLVAATTTVGAGWWFAHPASCLRFGCWPVLARIRRWLY